MALEEAISHDFHIPVLGVGFSLNTPIKVSHFGIDSVMSLAEDNIIELLRGYYAGLTGEDYVPITKKDDDHRAKRITSYLNMVKQIADQNLEDMAAQSFDDVGNDLNKTFQLLSPEHDLRRLYDRFKNGEKDLEAKLRSGLSQGAIDVNIMTKLDLPDPRHPDDDRYREAHAALRGFAKSDLHSSLVLSAGMNPKLFKYLGELEQFQPDANGNLDKKIILKVSDYRSGWIQAMQLAKQGAWVSEFRVESGLNCGGHAFGNKTGQMVGPILDEFSRERDSLHEKLEKVYQDATGRAVSFERAKLTYQGGIKNHEDIRTVKKYVDKVGVGTPFLYVPEATNIMPENLELLKKAGKNDFILSGLSPLNSEEHPLPFWVLAHTAGLKQREESQAAGIYGVKCPYQKLLTEYNGALICQASNKRMGQAVAATEELPSGPEQEFRSEFAKEKQCLCVGLSKDIKYILGLVDGFSDEYGKAVVCAGPSGQYFDRTYTLLEMAQLLNGDARQSILPFPQLDELGINLEKIDKDIVRANFSKKKDKELKAIRKAMDGIQESINFYLNNLKTFDPRQDEVAGQLQDYQKTFNEIRRTIPL